MYVFIGKGEGSNDLIFLQTSYVMVPRPNPLVARRSCRLSPRNRGQTERKSADDELRSGGVKFFLNERSPLASSVQSPVRASTPQRLEVRPKSSSTKFRVAWLWFINLVHLQPRLGVACSRDV